MEMKTYRNKNSIFLLSIFGFGLGWLIMPAILWGLFDTSPSPYSSFFWKLFSLTFYLILWILLSLPWLFYFWRNKISLTNNGVEIVKLFSTQKISWGDIQSIRGKRRFRTPPDFRAIWGGYVRTIVFNVKTKEGKRKMIKQGVTHYGDLKTLTAELKTICNSKNIKTSGLDDLSVKLPFLKEYLGPLSYTLVGVGFLIVAIITLVIAVILSLIK